MSRSKYKSTISGLIDSDSDDSQFIHKDTMSTADSENKLAAKKVRGRPKALADTAKPAKVTKAKAPVRRVSGRVSAKMKAPAKRAKRTALADKTNQQAASDTEEVDDFEQNEDLQMADAISGDELDDATVNTKENKSKPTKKRAAAGRGKAEKEVPTTQSNEVEILEVPHIKTRATKKKVEAKKAPIPEPSPEKVILESQIPQMEVDQYSDEEVEPQKVQISRASRAPRDYTEARARQVSTQRRGGSASDTERSDPAIRRKLGEITKKYENLNVKYQDLREIGLKEAERNFERLKKNSEEKSSNANHLISSLKADLAAQSALAKEARDLKKKVDLQSKEITDMQAKLDEMKTALSEAQNENKTLSAKLAANRKAAATYESANSKTPGSSIKANGGIRMMGTAEAAQVAQAAQLKEDIYSDLTGLIIRGVKREAEEDVFDCIQTGRNGTLHFKLAVGNEKAGNSDCLYTPQLDRDRDEPLLELLPDYLADEIEFPRPQAAKFYARVSKALTEKDVRQDRQTSNE